MLWSVYCLDNPNSAAARDSSIKEHREYLKGKESMIVVGGPLQSDDGAASVGSQFIVKAESRAEVQAFSDGDPFAKAGVFASVTIRRMHVGRLNPEVAAGK